jgi:hypothetical protein
MARRSLPLARWSDLDSKVRLASQRLSRFQTPSFIWCLDADETALPLGARAELLLIAVSPPTRY